MTRREAINPDQASSLGGDFIQGYWTIARLLPVAECCSKACHSPVDGVLACNMGVVWGGKKQEGKMRKGRTASIKSLRPLLLD